MVIEQLKLIISWYPSTEPISGKAILEISCSRLAVYTHRPAKLQREYIEPY